MKGMKSSPGEAMQLGSQCETTGLKLTGTHLPSYQADSSAINTLQYTCFKVN